MLSCCRHTYEKYISEHGFIQPMAFTSQCMFAWFGEEERLEDGNKNQQSPGEELSRVYREHFLLFWTIFVTIYLLSFIPAFLLPFICSCECHQVNKTVMH